MSIWCCITTYVHLVLHHNVCPTHTDPPRIHPPKPPLGHYSLTHDHPLFPLPTTTIITATLRDCRQWAVTLPRLRLGKFRGDRVLDHLQVSDTKAVVFTDRHLVCVETRKTRVRWSVPMQHYTGHETQGLVVTVHYEVRKHLDDE